VRGTGGAPHAVSRFAGDRRVVAVRPEPRGRLGFGAPLDSACGARRSPGWCRGIACWGGSGWRGPLDSACGALHAVSRFAGDRRAVALRPEPRGRLGVGGGSGCLGALPIHAVSRFAGDRRAVALRPEPRGCLGVVGPPRLGLWLSSIPRLAPGDCVLGRLGYGGVRCWAGYGWRSPRCLPLCGGPASGRPATRAEGVAWVGGGHGSVLPGMTRRACSWSSVSP
jgi:hypothetical protein